MRLRVLRLIYHFSLVGLGVAICATLFLPGNSLLAQIEQPTELPKVQPSSTPETVPAETPVATPFHQLSPSDVLEDRSIWPTEISLIKPVPMPARYQGKIIGTIEKPPGTTLPLVNILSQSVVVLFDRSNTEIPIASTDLLERAERLRPKGENLDALTTVLKTHAPGIQAEDLTKPKPSPGAVPGPFLPVSRLQIELVRINRAKPAGASVATDQIQFKIRLQNPDLKLSTPKISGTLFVFAGNPLQRNQHILLGRSRFNATIGPRNEEAVESSTFTCSSYWGAGAITVSPCKYEGWILELKDPNGKTLLTKASGAALEKGFELLPKFQTSGLYDRDFKFKSLVSIAH